MFEPFHALWTTARDWNTQSKNWKQLKFVDLNAEVVENDTNQFYKSVSKACKYFHRCELSEQLANANFIKAQIGEFLPQVPLITTLRNPGMRTRHWERISRELRIAILPIEDFTTQDILDLDLTGSMDFLSKVSQIYVLSLCVGCFL